jgi:biopolymer transport protein TolQ
MDSLDHGEVIINLRLSSLLAHASFPIVAIVTLLLLASVAVWVIGILKLLQVRRLRAQTLLFEARSQLQDTASQLVTMVKSAEESPGSRIFRVMLTRAAPPDLMRLRAAADRAIVDERQRARLLMPVLASVGAAAPFVGLFGTVYGIMDAFVRIGAAKNASLPVVAPAIGEALITTAIGLAAAIPAVLFYNLIDKQISDFLAELEASAAEWIALMVSTDSQAPRSSPMSPTAPRMDGAL